MKEKINLFKKKANPIVSANLISKWSFWWVLSLLYKGYHSPLEEHEIYAEPPKLDSERLTKKFTKLWDEEIKRKNPNILRLIIKAYGFTIFRCAFLYATMETIGKVMQTINLGALLNALADKSDYENKQLYIYLNASGIVFFSVFVPLLYSPYALYIFSISGRIRLGLGGLIYKKILTSSRNASNDELNGRAINLISNDLAKFDRALNLFQDLFKGPCQMFVLGYLIYLEIGWSALVGIAFIVILIPLQGWGAKKVAVYRKITAERSDRRVKLMNEIIQGIQVIKMYAWENSFSKRIREVRQTELNAINGTMNILAMLASTSIIPKVSIFLSLITYVYYGDEIIARKVFITSSLFNTLSFTMVILWPVSATYWAEAYISCKRVKEFLLYDCNNESNEKQSKHQYENFGYINSENISEKIVENYVRLEKVNASWNKKSNVLKNITLDIADKSLVAIVGSVGSGKSSLLNVILSELKINYGEMKVNGKLSYASQEPWIFEGTIKDNIVFIEDYNQEKYEKVIEVCALRKDFELMHNGDSTVVGERGSSLSGGQKARVNLARAIYRNADIYLLDDPLSAVDAHVGCHIFNKCISEYLKDKICILVTHQLQYLQNIANLVLIKSGEIEGTGSFKYLQEQKLFEFIDHKENSLNKSSSDLQNSTHDNISELPQQFEFIIEENREEKQGTGSVNSRIYKLYFKSVNSWSLVILVALLFTMGRTLAGGVDYFISRWVNWEESLIRNETSNTNWVINFYNTTEIDRTNNFERINIILTYTILLCGAVILFIGSNFGFFRMCLRISKFLHDDLYNGISKATMLFFNRNSSGRILNRFAKDIGTIDSIIPSILLDCITTIGNLSAVLIIVSISNLFFLIPALIVGVMFYFLRRFYIRPSRSIKRIEALTRSPIFSHINQTFQGLSTIRALNAEEQMQIYFHQHQNTNTSPWYMFIATSYAFSFWLDFVIFIYIASVTFVLIVFTSHTSSGDIGLAILQCISLVGNVQWGIKQSAELENQMISAERIQEYVEEPPEPSNKSILKDFNIETWPSNGKIIFKKFFMKYSETSKQVLKNLNFEIESNENIGIVGRTGAGKSSIIQAIFCLASNEGLIEIDGIDIQNIELHELRKKISIIPQDPVLFSGTIRYNLDPFEKSTDEDLWKVISAIQMKSHLSSKEGLDCIVNDGGSNFSVGQRQLICLARAMLRHNKILILDEATANVDLKTDQFIQNTIRTKFKNCTVLTIAHRLNTVMDSDKIMVMNDGNLVEMGNPKDLLEISNGYFNKLLHGELSK